MIPDVLARKIVPDANGCWIWTACRQHGYGYAVIPGRRKLARVHRVIYELLKEPIPAGLVLDHLCKNKACVNPEHLEAVTQKTNNIRMMTSRTICTEGHRLTPENIYISPSKGWRSCRQCRRARQARWKARR